jgi:hypothetical protein
MTLTTIAFGSASRRFATCAARVAPLLLLAAVSCGGGGQSAPPPAAPTAGEPAPAQTGPINWEAMDKAARQKYMKDVVLPKMKEHFVAFDAQKYGNMNCGTCHGPTAMHGTFEMPNPDLPKLPADMEKFKAWAGEHPKMAEFMGKVVKPEMAKLLNEPEYDPATGKGFGCGECHAVEK